MYPPDLWFSRNCRAISLSNAGGPMVKEAEKRRAPRPPGALPVKFEDGKGITRDFSSSGIFFETDKSFTPGQAIEFTIVLEYVDPDRPGRLKCMGEIVRAEENGQKIGVPPPITPDP